jgi:hypothetical protein
VKVRITNRNTYTVGGKTYRGARHRDGAEDIELSEEQIRQATRSGVRLEPVDARRALPKDEPKDEPKADDK